MKKRIFVPLVIATLLISGCKHKQVNVDLLTNSELKVVKTKRNFEKILKNSEERSYDNLMYAEDAFLTTTETTAVEPGAGNRDFVGTNLQDEAVDEADIIKTNGDDIYYLSQGTNKFTVFSVLDTHEIIKKHEIIEDNIQFKEMYLLDDYAVVIGLKSNYNNNAEGYWMPYYFEKSVILVYELSNMTKVYSLEVNYNIITTRLIDRSLYIVGSKYFYSGQDNILPTHSENNDRAEVMSYDDIYYFDETLAYGATLIGGLLLTKDSTDIKYEVDGYLGAIHSNKKVYVNENNLYISDSNYYYDHTNSYTSLTVSQFALQHENAKATFVAAATLRGAALNQFAMDEYKGYLRVATTDRESSWNRTLTGTLIWGTYKETVHNYLYILKLDSKTKTFNLISFISEGLGKPGETIRSVRFDGEKAYIVTFLQTDPLYVIDLSNHEKPVITDAIILPGFDTYQHPWGENNLIGLGYDADNNGIINGVKISAYDTTMGSASELQTKDINFTKVHSAYIYSEALSNHKALLVSPRHNIIALPVYGHVLLDSWAYHFEYIVYAIDFAAEEPISVLTRISHEENSQVYNPIRRAMLIENHIYTFSNNKVVTYDIENNTIINNVLTF